MNCLAQARVVYRAIEPCVGRIEFVLRVGSVGDKSLVTLPAVASRWRNERACQGRVNVGGTFSASLTEAWCELEESLMAGKTEELARAVTWCEDEQEVGRSEIREAAATTAITVRHNFESAHRLPQLGGKCQNLHGHSWWVEATVAGEAGTDGIVVEFHDLKSYLREWIDGNLDHGAMLGRDDELVSALKAADSKVFVFGESDPSFGLNWPTVENTAELLARVTAGYIRSRGWPGVRVSRVVVRETHVNAAEVSR
jgi:6-pyruvoyltetrahydropterin/6-carboxytetrahydropterin synthase